MNYWKIATTYFYRLTISFHFENIMRLISAGRLKMAASKYSDATKSIQAFCRTIY